MAEVAFTNARLAVERLAELVAHRALFGAATPFLMGFPASQYAAAFGGRRVRDGSRGRGRGCGYGYDDGCGRRRRRGCRVKCRCGNRVLFVHRPRRRELLIIRRPTMTRPVDDDDGGNIERYYVLYDGYYYCCGNRGWVAMNK